MEVFFKIDTKAYAEALVERFALNLDNELEQTKSEIINGIASKFSKGKADVDVYVQKYKRKALGYIIANAYTIVDSFGTGMESTLNFSDPIYKAYRSSEYWNPLRPNRAIYRRPIKTYINIFGEKVERKRKDGTEQSDEEIKNARQVKLKKQLTLSPSYAIQDAINRLMQEKIPKIIEKSLREVPMSKYCIPVVKGG